MKRDDAYCICCTGLVCHVRICRGSFVLLPFIFVPKKWQNVSWKSCCHPHTLFIVVCACGWLVNGAVAFQPCPCLINGHGDHVWWDMHHGDLGPGFVNSCYSTAAWYSSTKIMWHVQLHSHKQRFLIFLISLRNKWLIAAFGSDQTKRQWLIMKLNLQGGGSDSGSHAQFPPSSHFFFAWDKKDCLDFILSFK